MSACAPTGVRNNEARLKHEHTVVFAETCCQAKLLTVNNFLLVQQQQLIGDDDEGIWNMLL